MTLPHWGGIQVINKEIAPALRNRAVNSLWDKLFRRQLLVTTALAAMLAGVVIGEGLRPFAIPFYVAIAPTNPVLAAAGLVLGHLATAGKEVFWLILPLAPIYLIRIRAPTQNWPALILLALAGQVMFRLPTLVSQPMLGYDWLLLFMEFSLAATGSLIFNQAGCALRHGPRGSEEGLEQSLSLVVTGALALTSLAGASIGPFNILAVAASWLVLTAALAGGSGVGACAGLVAGILAGLGHVHPSLLVATLAMAGLLAGLFGAWGKVGAFAGFSLGIIAMLIYGGSPTIGIGFADLCLAGLSFLVTPKAVREKARRLLACPSGEWAWEYQQRLRRSTVLKLQKIAMVFSRLSNSFDSCGVKDMAGAHLEMSRMFDQLAGTVCTGCIHYKRCWEKELYSTYSQLMSYLTRGGGSGEFNGLLARRCHNLEELLAQAENYYRQFATERHWASKIHECKDVVSEQLRGVADVIGQLARQIRLDINCRQDLEEELAERLRNWGVEVYDLSVQGTERNLPQVRLRAKVPAGENPLGVLQALVAEVVGGPMQLVENVPVGDANSLIFAIPIKYKLELGVAQTAKGEVSGDCFSHLQTTAGHHVYMLSDGMGKGMGARAESNQALHLARDMLEAGFSAETVIKALNSLLVLRGSEKFATLDMAVIDNTLGTLRVFKTGAAPSFVKLGPKVELIAGAGLPIGIVPGIEPRQVVRSLCSGQYLVMVSDGVIDGQGRDEDWLIGQLQTMGNLAPSTMARQLLNRAARLGTQLEDDATVMVVRIREAKNEAYWERRAV
jgi:stage II sporulation protein E